MGPATGPHTPPVGSGDLRRPPVRPGWAVLDRWEPFFSGRRLPGSLGERWARTGPQTSVPYGAEGYVSGPGASSSRPGHSGESGRFRSSIGPGQDFCHPTLHQCVNSVTLPRTSVRHAVCTDERANPPRGGDAKLRGSLSRPGRRIGQDARGRRARPAIPAPRGSREGHRVSDRTFCKRSIQRARWWDCFYRVVLEGEPPGTGLSCIAHPPPRFATAPHRPLVCARIRACADSGTRKRGFCSARVGGR